MSVDTPRNRAIARAIRSAHETSNPRPNYSLVAVLKDGAGISFGPGQATDRSDTLDAIVRRYVELHGELADALAAYLPRFADNSPAALAARAADAHLKALLHAAGREPAMARAYDEVYDRKYLEPAIRACDGSGWRDPLSLCVVFDSLVHGSWERIRDMVPSAPERKWIAAYVSTRAGQLRRAGTPGSIFQGRREHMAQLRNTAYRMRTFERMIDAGNWTATPPIVTGNGVHINLEDVKP